MTKVVTAVVVLFLCVTQVAMTCTELSERLSSSVFQKLRLLGSTYIVESSRTQYHCAMQCMYDVICASFNYDTTTSSCELNSETSTTTPGKVVNVPGWLNANADSFPQALTDCACRTTMSLDVGQHIIHAESELVLVLGRVSDAKLFGLTISLGKNEVLLQPTPSTNPPAQPIVIDDAQLANVGHSGNMQIKIHKQALIGSCAARPCPRGSVCTYGTTQCLERNLCVQFEGGNAFYRGMHNMTRSGKTCQRWDSHTPHEHRGKNDSPSNMQTITSMEEAGNRCLTEFNDSVPWCYTTDTSLRWEHCSIPNC